MGGIPPTVAFEEACRMGRPALIKSYDKVAPPGSDLPGFIETSIERVLPLTVAFKKSTKKAGGLFHPEVGVIARLLIV
jgi:hypothetical protein